MSFLQVTDARDGQSRTIRQFQFVDWPEQGVPKSGEGFIDFIGQVHKTKEQFGQDGPITVHCRYVGIKNCTKEAIIDKCFIFAVLVWVVQVFLLL